ncbi:MAG: histidinol-phosphatase HisJ family protein [Ruminococcaceae bacterium]|nr:histidinol-phosphatase HisJ family protein [Oscillospiraceae bacterium]
MIANYHTHTARCGHADGSDREYIEEAIKGGLKILGFADHAPFVYKNGFVSDMRMKLADVDGYFSSLTALREEYKNDIKIYIGFESEYIPELMEAQDALLREYPLDYMIMGEHFYEPEDRGVHCHARPMDNAALTKYIDVVIEGMKSGRYKYLAHPDMTRVAEKDEHFTKEFTRLCKFMKEAGLPVEVNMLGYVTKRIYPCDEFMKIAASVGTKAIIGCDAHSPDFLSDKEKHRAVNEYARSFGLEIIETLPGLD